MSNQLVPKKDAGSRVVGAVVNDGITTGVAVGSVLVMGIPVAGPVLSIAGFGFIFCRAVYRGFKGK